MPVRRETQFTLVIRADATAKIGAGHAMRCLTLAEAWVEEGVGAVAFVGRVDLPFVMERLAQLGVAQLRELPVGQNVVLLVDSYDTVVRGQLASQKGCVCRALVDDLGGAVPAGYDAVWNPNPYGVPALYPAFHGAVIAGPKAVPIRSGIPPWVRPSESRLGIALGGSLLSPHIQDALRALAASRRGESVVAIGSVGAVGAHKARANNPWLDLAECSVVIVGGGASAWEAANCGIPVVLAQIADNQELSANWARMNGVPVVDMRDEVQASVLAAAVGSAIPLARPLPRLERGARDVARLLGGTLSAVADDTTSSRAT